MGGRVKKQQLHKCFSQTLHNYALVHRRTVTSVAHTLPPHPHTHTHTIPPHTHLHRANQADIHELIRFFGVEEKGFQSRLEGVDSCSISNLQWQ